MVLILIRYKIELGQEKALFSQSESHLVMRAHIGQNFQVFEWDF